MTHPPKTEQDFVSVPREPTEAMVIAGGRQQAGPRGGPNSIWRAMLEAAPAQVSAQNDRFPTDQAENDGFRAPVIVSEKRVSKGEVERVKRVARAIFDCEDPTSGDPLGVLLHAHNPFIESDDIQEQIAAAFNIARVAARAAIADLSHPASPVTDPSAGVKVEPHLLEPVELPGNSGELPAGMKPWAGGRYEPDDWDGGDVQTRDGRVGTPIRWYHATDKEDREGSWLKDFDIIAYTPGHPVARAQQQGERG